MNFSDALFDPGCFCGRPDWWCGFPVTGRNFPPLSKQFLSD